VERYSKTGDRDTDTVLRGIDEIDVRHANDLTMRLAQIHELVVSTANTHKNSEDVINILSGIRPKYGKRNSVSAIERVTLCREFLSIFKDTSGFDRELFFGTSDILSESAKNTVEYVGNVYTDEAYRRFSDALGDADGKRALSFEEICEDVSGGSSEFGILPVENTENGKLARFYSLIDKYDLKIAAVTEVETSDDESTRFALVRKNIEYPKARFGSPDRIEFFITLGDDESLAEILSAADFCSMELYRIDSLPLSNHSGEYTLCPIFRLNGSDLDSFLLFMSLDFPRFTPIGIFKDLNNIKE